MTSSRLAAIQIHRTIVTLLTLVSAAWGQTAPDPIAAPGRLLDIGGHRLHVHCVGKGSPTVVIDGGAGTWSIHYSHIQAALAGEVRVCTYDRGGLGWSDPGPVPRTSGRMVDELHQLLHAAGAAPPLLLVGHSLGGYNVRIYQSRYPEEVGGLVLVDAAHPNQWDRLPPEWADGVRAEVGWLRGQAERARKGKIPGADIQPGRFTKHSPQWRDTHLAAQLTPKPYEGLALETESVFESATQVPHGHLGSLPLVVLTARRSFDRFAGSGLDTNEANKEWQVMQHELAKLSANVRHVFSEHDHGLHESDPESVVEAIRLGIVNVRGATSRAPAALGLRSDILPLASDRDIDTLLTQLEHAYRAMDADGLVSLFTDDVVQLDVNRRVHVKGRERWAAWTRDINAAHRRMDRRHRGRARVGDWVLVEIEWSGTVRGEALSELRRDVDYRYTGLALLRVRSGRIAEQVIYGDYATLIEQLAESASGPAPDWVARYFDQMVGTWVTDNSAYRTTSEPFDAYGMEWKRGLGGKTLVGRLYAIRDGKEAGTSWEFREFWHPGHSELIASQFGSDGTYGAGPHQRKSDGTMEMLQTFYDPDGDATRVGHRSELKANELTTRSFDVQADGTWKERRTYVWRRKA